MASVAQQAALAAAAKAADTTIVEDLLRDILVELREIKSLLSIPMFVDDDEE